MRLPRSSIPLTILIVMMAWSGFKVHLVFGHGDSYVREACSVTRYQEICVRSLSSFSHSAGRSPTRWARAGLSVALSEAKAVAEYIAKVKREGRVHGKRQRAALSDCTECFQDSIDNLHRSLGILRVFTEKGRVESEINDLVTWMSTALTDEDTCLDGFDEEEDKANNKSVVKAVKQRVVSVTYLTSNALALANRLGTATNPD